VRKVFGSRVVIHLAHVSTECIAHLDEPGLLHHSAEGEDVVLVR
jgi:hypothetical protein